MEMRSGPTHDVKGRWWKVVGEDAREYSVFAHCSRYILVDQPLRPSPPW